MLSVKIQCPAKINLTLKVLDKRPDGFHNIESVMQTISLYDYLTINVEPAETLQIKLSGNSKEIPYNEKNLVYKAAKLFCEELNKSKTESDISVILRAEPEESQNIKRSFALLRMTNNFNCKISINIEKNIPVAAGLAGGSTDAAGTIFGLNEIFKKPFSQEKLHELCAQLGSDLNVCLTGGRVLSKGRGEIVEPLEFEPFNLSLIKPENLGISAKEAYEKFAKKHPSPQPSPSKGEGDFALLPTLTLPNKGGSILSNSGEGFKRSDFQNDLEWAIIDDYKELQEIKSKYPSAVMSGSGSTYYIINDIFQNQKGYWISNNLFAVEFGVAVYNH
mgnify:CR=1 FL=1